MPNTRKIKYIKICPKKPFKVSYAHVTKLKSCNINTNKKNKRGTPSK